MTAWERLSMNLYVVSRALGKARDEVERLELEQAAILREMGIIERTPDTSGDRP